MAVNREPILKRCKSLGISPAVMGIAKETKRDPNANKRKKVSEYGMQLKENSKKSEKFKQIIEANASKAAPTWLDVNKDNQTAKVLRMPVKEDLDYDIEEHLIVELYSK